MQFILTQGHLVLALVLGIASLILLILKTKVHPFPALIIAACVTGLTAGLSPAATIGAISSGFGTTLGNIGVIIGLGVMMGQIIERTGAAERMALTFIKLFGRKNEGWAMSLTGFLVAIPIFCDSGFVILSSLAKAVSKKTRQSIVTVGVPLAAGLVITHSLVPPTPGPLGVAGTFGLDVGTFILVGILIALPMTAACTLYGRWLGKRIYQLPGEGDTWIRPEFHEEYAETDLTHDRELPGAWASFAPLLLPILLILLNTVCSAMGFKTGIFEFFLFLGTPIIAVGIGFLLALYTLALRIPRQSVLDEMNKGLASAAIIVFVTGGGAALGKVLQTSGVGDHIAQQILSANIPVILLPFLIATLVRFAQGSGTVAMLTAAGICAPIVQAAGGSMLVGAFAACVGSLFFSYFNDSYFWVVNTLMGFKDAKEQIRVYSVTSTIAWAVGFVMVLILNAVVG